MKKKPSDPNSLAADIVAEATGEPTKDGKNPAAVALGRLGGLKGGPARARLGKEVLSRIGKEGAAARWKGHAARWKHHKK